MYDELKDERIVNKVGGRFKLSTLIQKRLVQLNRGSRPLIDTNSEDMMGIVLKEILQDKIKLDTSNEVAVMGDATIEAPPLDLEKSVVNFVVPATTVEPASTFLFLKPLAELNWIRMRTIKPGIG